MLIKIYRTICRHGTIITTELITEVDAFDDIDLQELAEQHDGDFALIEEGDLCLTFN